MAKKKSVKSNKYQYVLWGLITIVFGIVVALVQHQYFTKVAGPEKEISSTMSSNRIISDGVSAEVLDVNENICEKIGIFLMGAPINTKDIEKHVDATLLDKIIRDVSSMEEYNELIKGEGEFNGLTGDDIKVDKGYSFSREVDSNTVQVGTRLAVSFKREGPNSGVKQNMLLEIVYSYLDGEWKIKELPVLSLLTDVPTFAGSSS